MGNFNKEKKFGGGKDRKKFGGRNFGGDRGGNGGFGGRRDEGKPQMHPATCSDCGKSCEVPFRPTGDKPVFCSDCFRNKRDDNSRNFRDEGNRDFGNKNSRQSFGDKRSYQNDNGRNTENYKAQFEQLNAKLDKILKALTPASSEETREMETPRSKKFQKAPKKKTDTNALKNRVTKTVAKKLTAKKSKDKKLAAKKSIVKKREGVDK